MRGSHWLAIGVLALGVGVSSGCRSSGPRRPVVSPEPGLAGAATTESTVADGTTQATPIKTVDIVDRHPLFFKPREYWETSGDNKIVKAAAATFIGVPAGVVGEVRQIFVGAPPRGPY